MSSSRRRSPQRSRRSTHAEDECYYAVLGLERSCSEEDIRRAYKKLAVRYHPDKNPDNREAAEQRFKIVAEAYEMLSDPQKRAQYDRYGKSGIGAREQQQMHDPFDVFRSFFGGHDPFAAFMGDPFFGSPFDMGMGMGSRSHGMASPFGFGFGMHSMMSSMMNDMQMMHNMGGMGGMGGSTFSMSTISNGGGTNRSVSQQTVIRDGKQITRTVTRTTQPDGTVHEDVEESINDHAPSQQRIGSRPHGSHRSSRHQPRLQ